ncbi:MAG: hypothetical protein JXR76_14360 [Deltaproteobacteria bacterium]|nr:hypothetical protein [Deltaproteobacteria bacterium]
MRKTFFLCALSWCVLSCVTDESSDPMDSSALESDSVTNSNPGSDIKTDTSANTLEGTGSNTAPNIQMDSIVETAWDSDSDSNTGTDTHANTATDADTQNNADSDTNINTDTNTDTLSNTDSDSDSDSHTAEDTATDSNPVCVLPDAFHWMDEGKPLAEPQNRWVSLSDFSACAYDDRMMMYSTYHDSSEIGIQMTVFYDWDSMDSAAQIPLPFYGAAPSLMYFAPKHIWVLAYHYCLTTESFCYRTSADPTNPNGWSDEQALLTEDITHSEYGAVDPDIICDNTTCYLFYTANNDHVYRASMPIGSFPGLFSGSQDILHHHAYYEAVQVYTVQGLGKYLMLVGNDSNPRSYNYLMADDLGGTWNFMGDFASERNAIFPIKWTSEIGHGDIFRQNPDQTHTIDACSKLQFLYSGRVPPSPSASYHLAYRPGLLTQHP